VAGRRRESFADARARRAAIDDPALVLEAAARFLEARSRSVHEVRRRLTSAGYQPGLVEDAITRLTDLGMLDDLAFARAWVESRDRARPRGERAIRDELRTKGLDRSVVDEVLADRREAALERAADIDPDGPGVSADRAAAERLLSRNTRALARVADPRQRRQRAYGLLARHGFDPETCREAAAAFLAEGEPAALDEG
jgi:regulatory protein